MTERPPVRAGRKPARGVPAMLVLAGLLASLSLSRAQAEGAVAITADGACPDAQLLSRVLEREGVVMTGDARWRLQVTSGSGRARLVVRHAERGEVTRRQVTSDDCAAIAEAFALIVSTALGDKEAPAPEPSPPEPSTPEPSTPEPSTPEPSTPEPSTPEPSPAAADSAAPEPVRTKTSIKPRRPEMGVSQPPGAAPPRAAARSLGRHVTLGASAVTPLRGAAGAKPGSWSPQLDGGFMLAGHRAKIAIALDRWTRLGENERVELRRRELTARAEWGPRLADKTLWARATAGGGAAVSWVEVGSSGPLVRVHPIVTGSLTAGLRLADHASLRTELLATGYPIADRYLDSSTDTEVGRAPHGTLALSLGLELSPGLF